MGRGKQAQRNQLAYIAIFLTLATAGCDAPSGDDRSGDLVRPSRPSVLLVTVDTLRADHLGAYGYGEATSPRIDQFAAQGALFETAYAPTGATSPSHATLFTSQSPLAHGLVRNGFPLATGEATLAEIMRQNGYRTAAFVSSFPLDRRFGFDRGFDHYDDAFDTATATFQTKEWEGVAIEKSFDRRGAETSDAAIGWIQRNAGGQPLFVWLHLFDPHFPYDPPGEFATVARAEPADSQVFAIARYDGEIRYVDRQVGRVVDRFDHLNGASLTVITSDHGEGLWSHGRRMHNRFLYEEELRVPLIFRWPGIISPETRLTQPAHLIDLVPTLVALLELDAEINAMDGMDLSSFLVGRSAPSTASGPRTLWLQRPYYSEGRPALGEEGYGFGLREGPWKFIEARAEGKRELYRLDDDPEETINLASQFSDRADAFSAQLHAWYATESAKAPRQDLVVPEGSERGLRSLGYVE